MSFDQSIWAGRKFRDNATGEFLVIPDDVQPRQFFAWGDSFIDVGNGVYSRAGGDFIELTESATKPDLEAEHCPACGGEIKDSDIALCLCPNCGVRCCEGVI